MVVRTDKGCPSCESVVPDKRNALISSPEVYCFVHLLISENMYLSHQDLRYDIIAVYNIYTGLAGQGLSFDICRPTNFSPQLS